MYEMRRHEQNNDTQGTWYVVMHTFVERCVEKLEGGRVELDIENPVIHGKQPVRPPPAARGELEKAVPCTASYHIDTRERNIWR